MLMCVSGDLYHRQDTVEKPGKVNSHSTKRLEDVVYDQHVVQPLHYIEELTRARSFT